MIELGSIGSHPTFTPTTARLTLSNHIDHWMARLSIKRSQHRVQPGLYSLGNPTPESPVFVTANYTLSFDALRSALQGVDGYILVLDTHGVNVWCAAGKGTFGTEELVLRIVSTRLKEVVSHRKLILPQLGAAGVSAHEVKQRSGFWVEYGPVRAADLPEYLRTHQATAEMRRVRFPLKSRLELIPMDFIQAFVPMLAAAIVLYFLGGWTASLAAVACVVAGNVLFPILLPWIPTHNFSTKGFLLGLLVSLPFGISAFMRHPEWTAWGRAGQALGFLLAMPAVTAFVALNFTGSTTFTSRSGVKKEIYRYIPLMAWTFGIGILCAVTFAFFH